MSCLNSDDLNQLLRIYQSSLEDNQFDNSLLQNYSTFSLDCEYNKKLFKRFLCRIWEIFEVYAQRKKLQQSQFAQQILKHQEQLYAGEMILPQFLEKVFTESRNANQIIEVRPERSQREVSIPSWYRNNQENKRLFNFYEKKFWKLYDILNLDQYHIESLVILHQTKDQNVERLLRISIERNQHINVVKWCEGIQNNSYDVIIEKRIKALESMRVPSQFRSPYVFDLSGRMTDRKSKSIKITPPRRLENRERKPESNQSLISPMRRPIPFLRTIKRDEGTINTATYSCSPSKFKKKIGVNKTVVMNLPDLNISQHQDQQRQTVIHHKDSKNRETFKKVPQQSNLLFQHTSTKSNNQNGITALLFLERNMKSYLSRFD